MQEGAGTFNLVRDRCKFTFAPGNFLTLNYVNSSKLSIVYASSKNNKLLLFLSLISTSKLYTFKGQEELVLWHFIFGHFDIKNVHHLIAVGGVKVKDPGAATCIMPLCRSYLAGKGKRAGLKITKKVPNLEHHDVLKSYDLLLLGRVSYDQYACRIKHEDFLILKEIKISIRCSWEELCL